MLDEKIKFFVPDNLASPSQILMVPMVQKLGQKLSTVEVVLLDYGTKLKSSV